MRQGARRKAQDGSRFTYYVLRITYCVSRSTLFALLALLILLASCSPLDPPLDPPRTPRIVFPTDNRIVPTRTPTPHPTATPTPRPTPVAPPVTEYRAVWVDGSGPGLQTPGQVTQLIRDCQSIGCNALLAQVRIHGNVLYAK